MEEEGRSIKLLLVILKCASSGENFVHMETVMEELGSGPGNSCHKVPASLGSRI